MFLLDFSGIASPMVTPIDHLDAYQREENISSSPMSDQIAQQLDDCASRPLTDSPTQGYGDFALEYRTSPSLTNPSSADQYTDSLFPTSPPSPRALQSRISPGSLPIQTGQKPQSPYSIGKMPDTTNTAPFSGGSQFLPMAHGHMSVEEHIPQSSETANTTPFSGGLQSSPVVHGLMSNNEPNLQLPETTTAAPFSGLTISTSGAWSYVKQQTKPPTF